MSWKLQGRSRIMRFDEELFVLKFGPTVYVDGKSTTEVVDRVAFLANVQPIQGRDLLLVPEHQRFLENYYVFTPYPFVITSGDVIDREGVRYQVQENQDWGSFQESRMMRVDVGYGATP